MIIVFLHFFSVSSVPPFVFSMLILSRFPRFWPRAFRSGKNPPQIMFTLTYLNATLTSHLTSVDSKQLTAKLNPPESTLTKNIGEGL